MNIKAITLLALLSVPVCYAVKHFFPVPTEHLGFVAGVVLFLINLLMVSVLIKQFLSGAVPSAAQPMPEAAGEDQSASANEADGAKENKKKVGGFMFLGSLKFIVLGVGIYFALAVFKYSPVFLVAGGGFGLLLAAALFQFNSLGQKS